MTEALLGHLPVGCGVGGLHGGDEPQIGQLPDVLGLQHLRMLDAVAQALPGVGQNHAEGAQHLPVGGIANGVDVDLIALRDGPGDHVGERRIAVEGESLALGRIRIGFDQRRPARAERAVGIEFHGPQKQAAVIELVLRPGLGERVEVFAHTADHGVDARRQPPFLAEAAVERPRLLVDARVMHAGQANRHHGFQRRLKRGFPFRFGRRGHVTGDEVFRRIHEHAGGLAVLAANDLPARRGLGGSRHLGKLHRFGIGPARVPIHAREPDRAVRHRRIQLLSSRETIQPPGLLIPAASLDPLGARVGLGKGPHLGQRLFERTGAGEVHLKRHLPKAHHMAVRINEARQHHRPAAIHNIRLPGTLLQHGAGTHRRNLAAVVDQRGLERLQAA